jgi:hypothetical protein
MLFLKPIADLTFEDVEEFCKRFRENIRVEYKSTFDDSVKKKLPKVLSSFANSYGGILIVGVVASSGVAQEPFEGTTLPEREPGLTVQNISRDGIYPEIPLTTSVIPSRVKGNAFLVVQVNESPKAPHAIENTTQVYVRTGESANPTTLADLGVLLQRRRDVFGRWEDFYSESVRLAERIGLNPNKPLLELRIGPLYPTEDLITREKVFDFLSDSILQSSIQFHDRAVRHPSGAILSHTDDTSRYLNIGTLGTIHYLQQLLKTNRQGLPIFLRAEEGGAVYPLWWITSPLLQILQVASTLMSRHGVSCNLRIEATLRNVANFQFTLSFNNNSLASKPVSTLSSTVPASADYPSDMLSGKIQEATVELLYQLRWPLGKDKPHTRDQIRPVVAAEFPQSQVFYSPASQG